MRFALTLALMPLPAAAWEFSPDPICTLSHATNDVALVITHDVENREYTLSMALKDGPWRPSQVFGIRYSGSAPIQISTTQHRLSQDRQTLTVSDSGFDNVLNGLEFNHTATAFTNAQEVSVRTRGIADPLEAFRACPAEPPATS